MREVTESDERVLGIHAWICDSCKREEQTLDDYGEKRRSRILSLDPAPPAKRGGLGINRDPILFGIVRRSRRFEARVASGRSGVWVYLGLYRSIQEAVQARDQALRRRKAA